MAMYDPQKPQPARASTGNGAWYREPMAPLSAMTIDTMKKPKATMPSVSRLQVRRLSNTHTHLSRSRQGELYHPSPTAITDDANSQLAALQTDDASVNQIQGEGVRRRSSLERV